MVKFSDQLNMKKCQVEVGDVVTINGLKPSHDDFSREYEVKDIFNGALVLKAKGSRTDHILKGSRLVYGRSCRTIAIFCFVEHQG